MNEFDSPKKRERDRIISSSGEGREPLKGAKSCEYAFLVLPER
jgi:hypothetical protein